MGRNQCGRRFRLSLMSLLIVCGVLAVALSPAYAGQGGGGAGAGGTVVALPELQNFTATANSEARTGLGPFVSILIAFVGCALLATRNVGLGLVGIAAGAIMGFMPGITSGTFTAAAADFAPVAANPFAGHWWSNAVGLLYLPTQALAALPDPVFWVVSALSVVVLRYAMQARNNVEVA